MTFSMTLTEP